jgi:hypothetical protein
MTDGWRAQQETEHHADGVAAARTSSRAIIGGLLAIVAMEHEGRQPSDAPTALRWHTFDEDRDGRLEGRELAALLTRISTLPTMHLEPTPPDSRRRGHPPFHERLLFLVREDAELARALAAPATPTRVARA